MPTEPPRTSSANVPHPEPENILPRPIDQDQHDTVAHTALANARDSHTTSDQDLVPPARPVLEVFDNLFNTNQTEPLYNRNNSQPPPSAAAPIAAPVPTPLPSPSESPLENSLMDKVLKDSVTAHWCIKSGETSCFAQLPAHPSGPPKEVRYTCAACVKSNPNGQQEWKATTTQMNLIKKHAGTWTHFIAF